MIGIDLTYFSVADCLNGEAKQGTAIFAEELLDAFVRMGIHKNFCLIIFYDQESYIRKRFPQYQRCVVHWLPGELIFRITKGRRKLLSLRKYLRKTVMTSKVKRAAFSHIWYPYAIPDSIIALNIPALYTIHDLIPLHTDDSQVFLRKYMYMINFKGEIATISNYVKDDIKSRLEYKKRITVIPNSISISTENTTAVLALKRKFILDINAFTPHKNTITLLKAFAKISDQIDFDLVFCGSRKEEIYWNMLKGFIAENGLEERVHLLLAIPEEQKNWLLQNASLFVTPSMNEGFGRTPVEAAICGIPVISTKVTSLYEATMGLVHYYENPEDDEELAALILECLHNPDPKEKLDAISKQLSKEYAPETCARKYWEILKDFDTQQ